MSNTPDHRDLLGQPLAVGDAVVFPSSNTMYVGTVTKLNPKMIKVRRVGRSKWEQNKYPPRSCAGVGSGGNYVFADPESRITHAIFTRTRTD